MVLWYFQREGRWETAERQTQKGVNHVMTREAAKEYKILTKHGDAELGRVVVAVRG